jgi:signal transduction histidine kinase
MSSSSAFAGRRLSDLDAIRPARLWAILGAIALAALLNQLHLGVSRDSLWLMICCERWLDGQTAYLDFLENSPPPAILIYLPPVALAKALHVAREPLFVVYVIAVVAGCLSLCAAALRKTKQIAAFNAPILIGAATTLLLIPDYSFGERDHIALALSLPFLTILALRAEGVATPRWPALLAGCAAALACAIRPHYGLAFAPAVLYVAYRRGLPALLGFLELYATVAAVAVIGLASVAFFPRYFDTMLPITMASYVADHAPFIDMLVKSVIASWAMLAAALLVWRTGGKNNAFADVAAIASAGAALAYFVQAKGHAYQGYFAAALMFIAVTFVAGRELQRPAFWLTAPIANIAIMALAIVDGRGAGGITDRVLEGVLATAVALAIYALVAPARHLSRRFMSTLASGLACGALGVMLFGFHIGWRQPMFEPEARALGPHPKIALISDLSDLALPLISRVDGQWPHRVIELLLTSHCDTILERGVPDDDTRRRLEALKQLDVDMFLADVERTPPDAVIVEEGWAAKHFHDPKVTAWLAGYHRTVGVSFTRDDAPDPVAFYTRSAPTP